MINEIGLSLGSDPSKTIFNVSSSFIEYDKFSATGALQLLLSPPHTPQSSSCALPKHIPEQS